MSEHIFVDPPGSHDRPIDYVANPLRVDRPATPGNPARIDLIALANNIIARERDCNRLSELVAGLMSDILDMRARLDQLEKGRATGKLGRIVSAVSEILTEPDDFDEDDREF